MNTQKRLKAVESDTWDRVSSALNDANIPVGQSDAYEVPLEAQVASVAGFTIPLTNGVEEKKEKLRRLTQARTVFSQELSAQGIPVIATLPKNAWIALCTEWGLYRFENLNDGETYVSTDIISRFGLAALWALTCMTVIGVHMMADSSFIAGFVAIACLAPVTYMLSKHDYKNIGDFATFVCIGCIPGILTASSISDALLLMREGKDPLTGLTFILSCAVGALVAFGSCILSSMLDSCTRSGWFVEGVLNFLPRNLQCRILWPRGVDEEDGEVKTSVSFPAPPQDVAQVLMKVCKRYQVKVAAVPAAIAIDTKKIERSMRDAELERERMLREDPIIYIEKNGAVAVVAQFGEFPVEKQLVEALPTLRWMP